MIRLPLDIAACYEAMRERAAENANFDLLGFIRQRMGQRIATLRKLAGLSQEQLAERAGIGRGHLSRIEAGKYEVTLWIVQAIAEALGMTVDIIDERLRDLAPLRVLT